MQIPRAHLCLSPAAVGENLALVAGGLAPGNCRCALARHGRDSRPCSRPPFLYIPSIPTSYHQPSNFMSYIEHVNGDLHKLQVNITLRSDTARSFVSVPSRRGRESCPRRGGLAPGNCRCALARHERGSRPCSSAPFALILYSPQVQLVVTNKVN